MTPFITRLGFRAGALFSHQGVHVLNLHHPLDVNFNNPYKTADFLFFDDKEDAKKTNNNVVKGCLIHAHEDINNLSPLSQLASDHLILILNCVAVGKRQSLRLQAIGVTGRVILQCV